MIISPQDLSSAVDIVRELYEKDFQVPSGSGSRMNWGPPLSGHHENISIKNLNQVVEHHVEDLTITVEAECTHDLQELLADQ